MMADLFTLVGVVPLDRRNKQEGQGPFKRPQMGMYYGGELDHEKVAAKKPAPIPKTQGAYHPAFKRTVNTYNQALSKK